VDERAARNGFEEFALAELGGLLRYAVMLTATVSLLATWSKT
jgi:hypothetical protein